jgi:hypothetical protein
MIGHLPMKLFLAELLERRLDNPSWQWFQATLATLEVSHQQRQLLSAYTAMSRRVGKTPFWLDASEKRRLHEIQPLFSFDHWGVDDAGRTALLLALSDNISNPASYAELARSCYEYGDSREQQSWLRSVSLLPGCEVFVDTATDACRTNIMPLFESIACENPYPLRYFPELNFNQMVLKGLFNGTALSRVVGLDERFNPELSRMADDYVSEREAAGRHIPPDIWLVIAPRIPRERLHRVHRYLGHENYQHRYWAAMALSYTNDPASRAALEKQREREREPELIQVMEASLAKMSGSPSRGAES